MMTGMTANRIWVSKQGNNTDRSDETKTDDDDDDGGDSEGRRSCLMILQGGKVDQDPTKPTRRYGFYREIKGPGFKMIDRAGRLLLMMKDRERTGAQRKENWNKIGDLLVTQISGTVSWGSPVRLAYEYFCTCLG